MTNLFDFARRIGEDLGETAPALGILLRVTVLLLVATIAAVALRRCSAALRHLVWTVSLVGTLVIPLCCCALPAWQWAILPQRQPSPSPAPTAPTTAGTPHAASSVASPTEDAPPAMWLPSAHARYSSVVSNDESSQVPTRPAPTADVYQTTPPLSPQPRWSWSVFFAATWALGSVLGLAWIGIGVMAAWYVARRANPTADSRWREILLQLLSRCGIRRPIEVRECPQVSVPMTWGLHRPVILVPAGSAAWPEEVKRSVLLHELGHIRRADCMILLLGRLACAAYWFHPLAWLAVRQLRKTSEQAADDLVLAANIARPDYAEHLVGIAARMRGLHLFGHVALPMASPSDLEGRVLAILDPRRNHRSLKRKTSYALLVLAALLVVPCALLRLGYAKDKEAEESTSGNRNAPAEGQPAAEKQPPPADRKAQSELDVAEAKYNAAKAKAEDDIDVRYAIASAAVAKAEYEINKKASQSAPGSVPKERLSELLLKCKEYDLAIEKARLDQRIAGEDAKFAKAEFEKARRPDDRKAQRELEVAEAEANYNVAKAKAEDDINLRYAIAAAEVAKTEYEVNKKANESDPGSIPKIRLNMLSLRCKEADLAIEKTRREQRIAGEEAKVAKAEFEKVKRKTADEHSAPPASEGKNGSGPAKAGTTSAAPAEQPPVLLTAFGKVIDPAGKPVAGVAVYLREWSRRRVGMELHTDNLNDILATIQTDTDGAFRFENVAAKPLFNLGPGEIPWDVVVVAKPYAIAWRHLSAPQESKPMTITMAPEAKITGRVTDPQGRPLQNAQVKVDEIGTLGKLNPPSTDPKTLDLGFSRIAPVGKTDADGTVTITGLPLDLLIVVVVTHDDFRSKPRLVATTDQPQADVEMPYFADGKRKVRSYKVYSTTFSATLDPPLNRLVGWVTAADSKKPLPQTTIVEPYGRRGTMTGQDGRFMLMDVREARCRLFIHGPKGGDYLGRLLLVDVPKEKKEIAVNVELARGQVLSGMVVDAETGKGVADVDVSFDTGLDINTATIEAPISSDATTDSAGRFRLVVPPGKGKIRITGPVHGYDAPFSVHPAEDIDGFFKEVEVITGKPIADVVFTLHRGVPKGTGRTVEGNVVDADGKPVPGADVGPSTWFRDIDAEVYPVQSDEAGHFSFPVTPRQFPDEITVIAIHKERKLRGHVLLSNVFQAKTAKTPLEIRLVPTGIVRGRVIDGEKPIIGAGVQLSEFAPVKGDFSAMLIVTNKDWTKTDENGRFEFPFVEADKKFGIQVYIKGYTSEIHAGQVATGQTLEVQPFSMMKLDKSVAGTVVDPDGHPVAGVTIQVDMRSGGAIKPVHIPQGETFRRPTGKDGRFTIRGVPNVPLTIMAFIQQPIVSKDRALHYYVHVDAEPGQMDVRIVFDPKLVQSKH